MRIAVLLLSLVVLAGCSLGDSEQGDEALEGPAPPGVAEPAAVGDRDCVGLWALAAPVFRPNLLSRTIEERIAGTVAVGTARLKSVSYDLPSRARNNRVDLGRVMLEFDVLEYLKPSHYEPATVRAVMHVGYACEYIENDERDGEALAKMSADLEDFFGNKLLVMFHPMYHHEFHMKRATVSYHEEQFGDDAPLEIRYGLWRDWNDGSQWLLQAEGIGSDDNPHFVDPLDALPTADVPENTISLEEIREKLQAVRAEEEERGVVCLGAYYQHQWYVRSGEERYYPGRLGADGTPIECIAACNQTQ